MVRSSLGVAVGVIPGLGGSVVDWIAYGHAVQTTKNKEKFGSGEIRGVIAPESANNAKEGGGLVPTLLFGIPGSGSMAIFIGALALLGQGELEPGQQMLTEDLDVTYAIVWMLVSECPRDHPMYRTIKPNRPTNQYTVCLDRAICVHDCLFCRVPVGSELAGPGCIDGNWADRHSPEAF